MPVMVKALGYLSHKTPQGLRRVKAHLKYLEFGKQHRNVPEGFNDREEPVTRAEFYDLVKNQPARGVIAHKLVFSLSEDERNRCGVNMRDLVRETMDQWSQELGRPLNWVGFEHDDAGHPHVHVVVAGYAGGKQVGIYERDIHRLRRFADREKERQAELNRLVPERRVADRSDREEADRLLCRGGRERDRDFRGR